MTSRIDISLRNAIELLTLVAVIVGLSFAAIELRQLRNAQEAQTLLQLFETIKSDQYVAASEMVRALPYDLTAEELDQRMSREDRLLLTQITLTYETLGVMVFRGDISIYWVNELFRMMILQTWDKASPIAYRDRERSGYGAINEWVQWLAERLREIDPEQNVPAYEAYKDWRP